MVFKRLTKIYHLLIVVIFISSCKSNESTNAKTFNISQQEHAFLEKFFRYFMFYETAIYTLAGSKPLTRLSLFYQTLPEHQLREQSRASYFYFLLNKDNKKDMQFFEKLSSEEKKEKAFLISDKDFIYNIEELWDAWEQVQARFQIKKKFLLVKKQRKNESWKTNFPDCKAVFDVYFINTHKTSLVIQENYELFKNAVGYDFDPLSVVLELENGNSKFWDVITGEESWRYAVLWGILFGFGKENAFSYMWKCRNIKEPQRTDQEKLWSQQLESRSSAKNRPSFSDKGAFSISNFTIPIFSSFIEHDPIVAMYEMERNKIKKLYRGKDFVQCTLELLCDLPKENQ